MTYQISTDLTLPRPLDEVFEFFADASNLEAITPPELKFRIVTPMPIEMRTGALIEYRLSLFGIPFSWLTEISVWEEGRRFVDRQISGPFRVWHHEHCFQAIDERTSRITDSVHYSLPLPPVGRLVHPIVRPQLNRIFSYRSERVRELLA
jgi:ligand-binding SRPBCC domain-containing protein